MDHKQHSSSIPSAAKDATTCTSSICAAISFSRCPSAAISFSRCPSAAISFSRCPSAAISFSRCPSAATASEGGTRHSRNPPWRQHRPPSFDFPIGLYSLGEIHFSLPNFHSSSVDEVLGDLNSICMQLHGSSLIQMCFRSVTV